MSKDNNTQFAVSGCWEIKPLADVSNIDQVFIIRVLSLDDKIKVLQPTVSEGQNFDRQLDNLVPLKKLWVT